MDEVEIRKPGGLKRATANFIAGLLVGVGRLVYSIVRSIFMLLESLV